MIHAGNWYETWIGWLDTRWSMNCARAQHEKNVDRARRFAWEWFVKLLYERYCCGSNAAIMLLLLDSCVLYPASIYIGRNYFMFMLPWHCLEWLPITSLLLCTSQFWRLTNDLNELLKEQLDESLCPLCQPVAGSLLFVFLISLFLCVRTLLEFW